MAEPTAGQDRPPSRLGRIAAPYRTVLRNPRLVRLMIGEFVSSIGDWLYLVAIMFVVYAATESAAWLGIIGAVRVLPYVFLSLPAGMAADRFDRRWILIITDLARGIIMLAIAALVMLDGPIVAIAALTTLAACFSAFFGPAIGAYLPTLVDDERELGPANSAWSSLDNLAFFIGPAVAGILIATVGLPIVFLLNALSFGFVALVLWRLPSTGRFSMGTEEDGARGPGIIAALRPIAAPLGGISLLNLTGGFIYGGLGVLTVMLAFEVLGAGEAAAGELIGYMNAAIGLGALLGAVAAGSLVVGRRLSVPILLGGVLLGVAIATLGLAESLVLMLVVLAGAGAGSLLVEVASTTLLQRVVPDEMRGRALGVIDTVYVSAYAGGAFLIVVAVEALGVGPVLLGAGGVFLASLAGALLLLAGPAAAAGDLDPARRRFVELPLFAGLSPARLEDAARHLVAVSVAPGEAIIRQGDPADRFYFIVAGAFAVSQLADGDERPLRTMGPGEVFGEIGLLTGAPRTATVEAVEAGELLALDGDVFLRLVAAGRQAGISSRLLDLRRSPGMPGQEYGRSSA